MAGGGDRLGQVRPRFEAAGIGELKGEHRSPATELRKGRHTFNQGFQDFPGGVFNGPGAGQEAAVLKLLEDGERGFTGQRVAGVGSAQAAGVHGVHQLRPAGDGGKRKTAGQSLGAERDISGDTLVFAGKQLSGAAHAGLDFVHHKDNSVLVRERAQTLQEARGGNHKTALALDGLDHHGGKGFRAVLGEQLLDSGQRGVGSPGTRPFCAGRAQRIGRGSALHLIRQRAEIQPVGVLLGRHGHGEQAAAVVGLVEHQDVGPAGSGAGNFDGVFHGFCAGGEQGRALLEVPGGVFVQPAADLCEGIVFRDHKAGVRELFELRRNTLPDPGVGRAHTCHCNSGGEVNQTVPVHVLQDPAVGPLDEDRQGGAESGTHLILALRVQLAGTRAWNRGFEVSGLLQRGFSGGGGGSHEHTLRTGATCVIEHSGQIWAGYRMIYPMVSLSELCAVLGTHLVPVNGRSLPARELSGVHVSELVDPTPYLDGGELLLTTGMPLGGNPAATRQYVERLRSRGVHALGIGLGPWLAEVPEYLCAACDEAQIHLLAVPDGVPFQNVSRSYWALSARSGQAELMGSLGTQTSLAQAAMRPGGAAAVIRGLAQALGGWAAFLPSSGTEPVRYWPESTGALLPLLREETLRLNRAGTHSAATFELHGQPVVEYPITAGGRIHGFLAVGPGRKLAAPDRQVIMTVCTLLALKARQREAASGAAAVLEGAVAKLVLHGHTEAARILAEDAGHPELPRRVRVLALAAGPGAGEGPQTGAEDLLGAAPALKPAPGVPPLPEQLSGCPLRHERDGVLYVLLSAEDCPQRETRIPAAQMPELSGAVSDPVSLAEVPGVLPGLRRALAQAAAGTLAGTAGPAHAAAEAWVRTLTAYPRADLAGTVTEYLRHRGHWENASRALGVHRNSLRHRIALASSLLGVDLDDPDVFAPLWLELRQRER